ncbi:hypothetical protein C7974DRAFT_371613 [Boeremia exigua]|uniref:uncharacterized protein n=1 Tax=Boeremia exigua TaxID=749465 RepID=UPI001E8E2C79|nr:uncharacterized protein C7974DRAFT_371613 [Boeremia exigua]KAH6644498.1 hypothetical protein C7974DRAFT_371613 [Boeremia exigua]
MPPALLSEHRSKRPFQPAITSYFYSAPDSDTDDDDADYHGPGLRSIPQPPPHPTLAPRLPDHVQSSLLSVGMRVRKSVPEGYKTPKPLALQPPPTHLQPPSASALLQTPHRKPHTAYHDSPLAIPLDPAAPSLQHARELLPFAGLPKPTATNPTATYAYAAQPAPALFLAPHAFSTPFPDAVRAAGKRSWADAAAPLGPRARVDEVPVSPLSAVPPPLPGRVVAVPRRRRRGVEVQVEVDEERGDGDVEMEIGMERGSAGCEGFVEGRVAAGCASDFEEADFLAGEEREREVVMGGV